MSDDDDDSPIYMLNVLWFKQDGGREMYARYVEAAAPFVAKYGGRLAESGYVPERAVIGEFDADLLFIVEYPSWESFLQLPQDPGYQEIAHLRQDALTNSLLVRCRYQPIELGS